MDAYAERTFAGGRPPPIAQWIAGSVIVAPLGLAAIAQTITFVVYAGFAALITAVAVVLPPFLARYTIRNSSFERELEIWARWHTTRIPLPSVTGMRLATIKEGLVGSLFDLRPSRWFRPHFLSFGWSTVVLIAT